MQHTQLQFHPPEFCWREREREPRTAAISALLARDHLFHNRSPLTADLLLIQPVCLQFDCSDPMIVDDKPNLNDGSADEQVQPKDDFGNFFCKLHLAFETWILILPLLAKVQL